jgi:FAD/FMN-containing dehydrogenase
MKHRPTGLPRRSASTRPPAAAPHAAGSVYINFLNEDEVDRIAEAYGPNYDRLRQIKAQYDPANLFRTNQNIRPA